jgi:hypothetical protein
MKTLAAALAAFAALVLAQGAAAGPSGAPCFSKHVMIAGKPALARCGPATATVSVGGRTYRFKNGTCATAPRTKTLLELNLGTLDLTGSTNNNRGLAYLTLLVRATRTGAVLAGKEGKDLPLGNLTASAALPGAGTFTGKGVRFSGSWNCHGTVYKEP